jgi:Family of unknown function (DUF5681)
MATPNKPADAPKPTPPKHTGGKFKKGVSGNPGGKKKVFTPPQKPIAPPQAPQEDASAQGPQPEVESPENSTQKQRRGGFQPGKSGNPAGKPKGARNHATRLAEALIDGQATELVQRAVEMAMAGDASVMRALLDRLVATRKERAINLAMPKITAAADLIAAASAIAEAATSGEITPGEAASLSSLVANTAKAIETAEIVERLTKLEEQLAGKPN